MDIFYKDGFYFSGMNEVPKGAVKISEGKYKELIMGQSQGKNIQTDLNGYPILAEEKPSNFHQWNGSAWVISEEKRLALLESQRQQARDAINTKRDQTDAGGVFVEALGKWVDSDEKAYQNILGVKASLDLLGDMDIPWTWADNSSSIINRTMLAAIVGALLQAKQQNHANALKHKAAMMVADNPLDYDYSQGWSKTYADHLAEVGNE